MTFQPHANRLPSLATMRNPSGVTPIRPMMVTRKAANEND